MNDSGRKQYDDEIDLFEIVEIIWQGKWIIVASVFIVLASAYAYQASKETVYEYNLSYSSSIPPDAEAFSDLLTLSDLPFSLNTKNMTLSLSSTNPNYEAMISSELAIIGNKHTQSLRDEANLTLKEIENKSQLLIDDANRTIKQIEKKSQRLADDAKFTLKLIKEDIPLQMLNSEETAKRYFQSKLILRHLTDGAEDIPIYVYRSDAATERHFQAELVLQSITYDGVFNREEDTPIYIYRSDAAAERFFKAKLVLQNITDGKNTIEFQPAVKTVKSPTFWLFPLLPVLMGGVLGLLFVFILRMVATYKKRQQVAI